VSKKRTGKLTSSAFGSSQGVPFTIDDSTSNDLIYNPIIDGQVMAHGLVKRDYSAYPKEMFQQPTELKLYPESEWDARFEEEEKQESSLEHIFNRMAKERGIQVPFLHQNGNGFCWAYSVGNATMLDRATRNMPYVRLNPHAVAAIIKNGRDEGGWCGLSAKFYRQFGCPTEEFWKVHSRDIRQDTPAMRADAAKYKTLEDWVDLQSSVYDATMTKQAIATCLFSKIPCPVDYDEWSHSICAGRWYRVEKGVWAPRILNSWLGWGDNGWGTINRRWTYDSTLGLRATGVA